jgi:hypothetical protein
MAVTRVITDEELLQLPRDGGQYEVVHGEPASTGVDPGADRGPTTGESYSPPEGFEHAEASWPERTRVSFAR